MRLIGLTGGPGAGKSSAGYYMSLKGATVISGDDIGREVIDLYPAVLKRLIKEFGGIILNPDGTLNRKKTGEIVFADSKALKKLNSIVHPYLLKLLKSRIKKLRVKQGRNVVVVDAALIYEWQIESWFDSVLVITATKAIRINRLIMSGHTRSEAVRRIASQIPQEEKARRADFVISNNGHKIALRNKVYAYMKKVKSAL